MPRTSKEVSISLMDGWAEIRMLIDGDGHIARNPETKGLDYLALKASSPEFIKLVPAIISSMTFERSTENPNTNFSKTMNRFKITIADQTIQVDQFSGD